MLKRPAALMLSAVTGGAASASTARHAPGTSIRVVTYNVMRFKDRDGGSTESAIGDALAALQPTLVALNEVDTQLRPTALTSVAERLGGFSVAFFGHVRGHYGNALLSKYPIKAVRETHLRGGTEFGFPAGTKKLNGDIAKEGEFHRIARGLLECDIELPATAEGPARTVTVAVTHLDHMNENQRRVQLEHVLEALGPNTDRALFIGDLNALNRSDYLEHEWATLEERAVANSWSPPTSGCLDLLSSAHFVDAFAVTRGPGPLSARTGGLDDPIFSAHVGHPLYRIDYCFVSAASGVHPVTAKVHTEVALSDHFPVSFDLGVSVAAACL